MLALHLDNVMVMNFNGGSALGLRFAPSAAGTAFLNVNNSYFWSNGNAPDTGANILIQPSAAGAAAVTITKSITIDCGGTFGSIFDLATGGRLRDGAREGLAWRGAAARVGVISNSRHPGPCCLRMDRRGFHQENDRCCKETER